LADAGFGPPAAMVSFIAGCPLKHAAKSKVAAQSNSRAAAPDCDAAKTEVAMTEAVRLVA
jgi:hypothetical protein